MAGTEDDGRSWTDDTGETYASLGQYRAQRSRSGPSFDPAEPTDDDLRTASKIVVRRRWEALVEAGAEEAAAKLTDPEYVSSFRDQQDLSRELIREHLGGE